MCLTFTLRVKAIHPVACSPAFSLVELSIVLVILGLLTGGILAGQSLIRAAELRSVATDYQRYTTAIYGFRSRYMALPGDMANAIDFWGAADASAATCATTVSPDQKTCNGDGDGSIETVAKVTNNSSSEVHRAWQHLANSGLIEGSFNGVPTAGIVSGSIEAYQCTAHLNCPAGRIADTGWGFAERRGSGSAEYYDRVYGNRLHFGASSNSAFTGPALRPEEQWNIDVKMDDGRPGTGSLVSYKSSSTTRGGCSTTDDSATAEYALTSRSIVCAIVIDLRD